MSCEHARTWMWRIDHNNNFGINAPEIEWSFEPDTDWGRRWGSGPGND